MFAKLAKAIPDHRAVIWRDKEWTYAGMDARVDGVAHYGYATGVSFLDGRVREPNFVVWQRWTATTAYP